MGFASSDWSEVIDSPTTEGLLTPDGVSSEEEFRSWDPIPVPVSSDGGKTLDWTRPAEGEAFIRALPFDFPLLCE